MGPAQPGYALKKPIDVLAGCLLRRELNISDGRWAVNHDSQCADYNLIPTRKFLSHEKQISDCFYVKKVNASIFAEQKDFNPTDRA